MLTDLCKLDKREYNAGRKNCQEAIADWGAVRVKEYFTAKSARLSKWCYPAVVSYWAGYEDVLRGVTL